MAPFASVSGLKKATRRSSCWLRRGDDCRRGAHRLVGRIADALGLGFGVRHRETSDRLVPHGFRPRRRAPRQESTLRIRGRPLGGGCRCRRSGPGSVGLRFWHRSLADAADCASAIWGSLVPDDKRDASGDRPRGRLAGAQPLRRAALRRDRARRRRRRHGGVRVVCLPEWHRHLRNMQELVNTWVPFGTRLGKAAVSESLVERSVRTGKLQASSLFIGSVTKRLMFGIFVPVQIDGENRDVLGRSQDHHALARWSQQMSRRRVGMPSFPTPRIALSHGPNRRRVLRATTFRRKTKSSSRCGRGRTDSLKLVASRDAWRLLAGLTYCGGRRRAR
jgi:hypothetical protein